MKRRTRILFRIVAVVVLLLMGAELFACEMISPDQCESFGSPSGGSNGDDHCICCCTHILMAEVVTLSDVSGVIQVVVPGEPKAPESEPLAIYHPPRA